MILFTSLIFFPHLSAVRLNMWTEITLFADMFTRGFLLFLFSLALQREKYDVGEEGDDIHASFDYILFFSFSNICAYRSSESFDPGSKTRLLFRATCSLPSLDGNSSHEEIFSRLSSRGTLGCKQDQAESFKGNLLVACRFEGFLFHRRRDTLLPRMGKYVIHQTFETVYSDGGLKINCFKGIL